MMQRLFGWGPGTSTRRRRNPRVAASLSRDTTANLTHDELKAIMTPNDVDLVVLTFNCAKAAIMPDVFASHLLRTFKQDDTPTLPELVVL